MPLKPSLLATETLEVPEGKYPLSPYLGGITKVSAFDMDRFPISVAQYAQFIADGGYEDYEYWSDDGWYWLQTEGIQSPRFWNGENPSDDKMFNSVQGDLLAEFVEPTKPVIGVSWYEADAFCRFYNRQLPTEIQWEAAARGPQGNTYPWGDTWLSTGIGAWGNRSHSKRVTAAIGQFPESKGPFGHEDLVGNIWQWTSSPWDSSPSSERLAAKGGSWGSSASQCNTSARNGFHPTDQWTHVGFRTIALK